MISRHLRPLAVMTAATICLSFWACTTDPSEPPPAPDTNQVDRVALLIVAVDALAPELTRLASWKSSTGLPSQVITLSEALKNGHGADNAARLRDYIHQVWTRGSLTHVLLAGDYPAMPIRRVHTTADVTSESTFVEDNVATDLYFADLDASWDPDANGVFGELSDQADLLPDIAIGRLPADSSAEARAFVDKILAYEKTPRGDYEDKILFVGEYAG
ncbi:MAG: hypothetical protein KAI47_11975, partial [Deltaproteobacteria bacterium]|nr:hypothetical protein [Deltaproteobacteria bacterium]